MSGRRPGRLILAAVCGLFAGHIAPAANDEMPDIEFLDYLGSWEESDKDWQLVKEANEVREGIHNGGQSDPVPEGKESTEAENEE